MIGRPHLWRRGVKLARFGGGHDFCIFTLVQRHCGGRRRLKRNRRYDGLCPGDNAADTLQPCTGCCCCCCSSDRPGADNAQYEMRTTIAIIQHFVNRTHGQDVMHKENRAKSRSQIEIKCIPALSYTLEVCRKEIFTLLISLLIDFYEITSNE